MRSAGLLCSVLLLGLFAAKSSFAAVDMICDKRFVLQNGRGSLDLSYCANVDLVLGDAKLNRAIVVVHGINRNADDYFAYVLEAGIRADSANRTTAIIAPQFLSKSDLERHAPQNRLLYWSSSGWKKGNTSRSTPEHSRPFRISSFEVLDQILLRLGDHTAYPHMRTIVVVGHSAGGQFANRYSAGGAAEVRLALKRPDLSIRYIAANPSSYLYFSPERVVEGTLDSFSVPNIASCPSYDDYHYGLQDLNRYMRNVGASELGKRYRSRRVVTLLGGYDSDPDHSSLAIGCAAMLQGHHRLERGQIYSNYIRRQFGTTIFDRHRFDLVKGVGHSAKRMFRSGCGLLHLYDFERDTRACVRRSMEMSP